MSVNQIGGGGMAFFGAGYFQSATSQIQQAPMQQLHQLQSMLQSSFQSFFQGMGQFQQSAGAGFAQSPAAMPGFVRPPSAGMMQPMNPGAMAGGGFIAGGFIAGGQIGGGHMGGHIGGMGTIGTPQPSQGKTGLIQTGKNPPEYTTPGGFKIAAEGKDMAWTITTPEGKKTRIWGDPHVHEGDGGKWDFKKDMSFVLPDGTKIGVKTVPWGKNGEATVTGSIDIMNGNERATIGNIDKNKNLTDTGVKGDRWALDARTPDGDYAVMGGNGDDWFLNGKNEIVGGNMKTGEIFTKASNGQNTNISQHAMNAMREPGQLGMAQQPGHGQIGPRFGGQQFVMQMMQQMMHQMMQMMQMMRR